MQGYHICGNIGSNMIFYTNVIIQSVRIFIDKRAFPFYIYVASFAP